MVTVMQPFAFKKTLKFNAVIFETVHSLQYSYNK